MSESSIQNRGSIPQGATVLIHHTERWGATVTPPRQQCSGPHMHCAMKSTSLIKQRLKMKSDLELEYKNLLKENEQLKEEVASLKIN